MQRKERMGSPWALVRAGKLSDLSDFLRESCFTDDSFAIDALDKTTGKTLLVTAIEAAPCPIRKEDAQHMNYVLCIRLLCEMYDADISFPCGRRRDTPAHYAVLKRNVDILKYLVATRKSPLNKNLDGLDPYALAVKLGYSDCVGFLQKEMEKRGMQLPSSPSHARNGTGGGKSAQEIHIGPQSPTYNRERARQSSRSYVSMAGNTEHSYPDPDTSVNRGRRVSSRAVRSTCSVEALDRGRTRRCQSPSDIRSHLTAGLKSPAALKHRFITTVCNIKEAPQFVHQEVADFNLLCPTAADVACLQIREMQRNTKPIGYLIRIKGLLPYTIRGNTYYGPVVVLAYYPSCLYEGSDVENNSAPLSARSGTNGDTFKSVNATADSTTGCQVASARLQKLNNCDKESLFPFFPRFRTFLDKSNLNRYFFNGRAAVYLDLFSGAFLPSPSDHMFSCLSMYVKYGVIRCFEAIPPIVLQESSAALSQIVPLSPNFERGMKPVSSQSLKRKHSSSLPFLLFPALRMCFHPVTNYCSSSPVPLKTRSGLSVLETFLYPHPYPEPVTFLSPISGDPFVPAKSMIEECENKPIPPPPMSFLLPFTFSRHPLFTSVMEGEESSSVGHHPSPVGLQTTEVLENHLGSSAFDFLRSFQIYQDLSSFADGMLTYTVDTQTVEGFLPIMGTRPKSFLVSDITDIEDFVLTSLGSTIPRTCSVDLPSAPKNRPTMAASFPFSRDNHRTESTGGEKSSKSSPSKTTAVYKLEVENVERLCNIKVRIEFKNNALLSSSSTSKGAGYGDNSSFDFPPRIFFPDAALPSGSSTTLGSLTHKCFEAVLQNSQTGELNPAFVLIPPSKEADDGTAPESSRNSALKLPRMDRSKVESKDKGASSCHSATPTSRYVRLLDPPRWREQSRPLLTLLVALKDLVTQLLSHMSTSKGDEELLSTQNLLDKGRAVSGLRSTVGASKNMGWLDGYFSGQDSGNTGNKKADEAPSSVTASSATSKNMGSSTRQSLDCPSSEKCIICFSQSKEIVYKPCFHRVSCKKCAAEHCLFELKCTHRFLVAHTTAASTPSGSQGRSCELDESVSTWKCELCAKPITGLCELYI